MHPSSPCLSQGLPDAALANPVFLGGGRFHYVDCWGAYLPDGRQAKSSIDLHWFTRGGSYGETSDIEVKALPENQP